MRPSQKLNLDGLEGLEGRCLFDATPVPPAGVVAAQMPVPQPIDSTTGLGIGTLIQTIATEIIGSLVNSVFPTATPDPLDPMDPTNTFPTSQMITPPK